MAAAALRRRRAPRPGSTPRPTWSAFNERIAVDGVAISDAALAEAVADGPGRLPVARRRRAGGAAQLLRVRHAGGAGPLRPRRGRGDGARGGAGRAARRHQRGDAGGDRGGRHRARPHPVARRHGRGGGAARRPASSSRASRRWSTRCSRPACSRCCARRPRRRARPSRSRRPGWDGPLALAGAAPARQRRAGGRGAAGAAAAPASPSARRRSPAGLATARWPGRLELVGGVLLDGAHNPDGAAGAGGRPGGAPPGTAGRAGLRRAGGQGPPRHAGRAGRRGPAAPPGGAGDAPGPRRARSWARAAGALGLAADAPRRAARGAGGGARRRRPRRALVVVAGSLYLVGEARACCAPGEGWRGAADIGGAGFFGPPGARAIFFAGFDRRSPPMRSSLPLAFCLFLAGAAQAQDLNVISGVEVRDEGNTVLVTVKGSKPPNFTTFSMADPARFVIDLSEARFQGVPEDVRRRRRDPGGEEPGLRLRRHRHRPGDDRLHRGRGAARRPDRGDLPGGAGGQAGRRGGRRGRVRRRGHARGHAAPPQRPRRRPAQRPRRRLPQRPRRAALRPRQRLRPPTCGQRRRRRWPPRGQREAEAGAGRGRGGQRPQRDAKAEADEAARREALAQEQREAEARLAAEADARAREAEKIAAEAAQAQKVQEAAAAAAATPPPRPRSTPRRRARSRRRWPPRQAAEARARARPPSRLRSQGRGGGGAARPGRGPPPPARPPVSPPRRSRRWRPPRCPPGRPSCRPSASSSCPPSRASSSRPASRPASPSPTSATTWCGWRWRTPGRPGATTPGPLDTSFFPSAVAMITPSKRGTSYVVDIKLRKRVPYQQKVEGDVLAIDFERPPAGRAPGAPRPRAAGPRAARATGRGRTSRGWWSPRTRRPRAPSPPTRRNPRRSRRRSSRVPGCRSSSPWPRPGSSSPPRRSPARVAARVNATTAAFDVATGTYRLEGNVVISRGAATLRAGKATYDPRTGEVTASGGVLLIDPTRVLSAEEVHAVLDGPFEAHQVVAYYKLKPTAVRRGGHARRGGPLRRRTACAPRDAWWRALGDGRLRLEEARLTLCDCASGGAPSWELRARSSVVQPGEEARLEWPVLYITPRFLFIDRPVPVMTLPWFTVPLAPQGLRPAGAPAQLDGADRLLGRPAGLPDAGPHRRPDADPQLRLRPVGRRRGARRPLGARSGDLGRGALGPAFGRGGAAAARPAGRPRQRSGAVQRNRRRPRTASGAAW